ncbi:MAG: cobamide remodeling phosphodiesterase CbiR [Chitinispirillaceae bacterium]
MTDCKTFPFLLGTTSYIIPDDIIPNARFLAPLVDDIELVLFESPDISNIPSEDDVCTLAEIAGQNSSGYTVHLPIDRKAGSEKTSDRELFCDSAKRIIDRCTLLNPRAWVLHLEGIDASADISDVAAWRERCCKVIEKILSAVDDPSTVAVENLGYPWEWHKELVEKYRMSCCCDVGHLWLYAHHNWKEHLKTMLPGTKVIHLHGVKEKKDHISLEAGDMSRIQSFFNIIKSEGYDGVITLEIFNESDFNGSVEVVESIWDQLH